MKVRASVKKRSADDKIVRRKGRIYVINKKNPATSSVRAERVKPEKLCHGSQVSTFRCTSAEKLR